MRSSGSATSCGRTSGRRHSTTRSSSTRAARGASGADELRGRLMRERALSAAVLVPPLVIALVIGGPAILLVVTVAAVLGAWEVFRLLRYAGYPSLPWLGVVLTGVLVLDAGLQPIPERSGLLLLAIGVILVAVGAFGRTDPRDGLVAW